MTDATAAAPTSPPPPTTPPSAYIPSGTNATAAPTANTPEWRSLGPAADPQDATSPGHVTGVSRVALIRPSSRAGPLNGRFPSAEKKKKKKKLSCAAFKDLDECRNKIPPLHSGYGLYNPDAATLYHCNCTSR